MSRTGGWVTGSVARLAERLPGWATLVRAPNPGPMTLDGTNTWVLRASGQDECVVVDPGPADEGHLKAVAAHGPVGLTLVTHGHDDHVEGVEDFGHPVRAVTDGDQFVAAGLTISVLATPGHTADSVCFLIDDGTERAVLSGDTILGRGTTVVAAPDGNLGDYLASLERLQELGSIPVLPGHGPALADCAAAAEYYLAHRQARLDQVRAAVTGGARTPADVVAVVYADVDRALWWAAEWSVRAQLDYLAGLGELDQT